jgi:hypothetical protein
VQSNLGEVILTLLRDALRRCRLFAALGSWSSFTSRSRKPKAEAMHGEKGCWLGLGAPEVNVGNQPFVESGAKSAWPRHEFYCDFFLLEKEINAFLHGIIVFDCGNHEKNVIKPHFGSLPKIR